MALHAYVKLGLIGVIFALFIAAFASQQGIDIRVHPEVEVLPASEAHITRVEEPAWPSYTLKATAYNSLPEQTNSQPFITATGARTRFGIIAVSRDLLSERIPYGSLVRIRDLGNYHNGHGHGKYQQVLDGQGYFIVEDTMHMRKREQIDIWFATLPEALDWGVRRVEVEVIRYGRDGPLAEPLEPVFTANR